MGAGKGGQHAQNLPPEAKPLPLPPFPSESLGVIYDLEGLGRNWEGLGSPVGGQLSGSSGFICTRRASWRPHGCLFEPRTKNSANSQVCVRAAKGGFWAVRPTHTAVHIPERRGLGVEEGHHVRTKVVDRRRCAVICRGVVVDHFHTTQTVAYLACEPQWCVLAYFWDILAKLGEICRRRPMFRAPFSSL